ncbi:hypothetical protein ACLOJK_029098 [Asimina triloba]
MKTSGKDQVLIKNGARLLDDLITSCDGRVYPFRIFSAEELRKATVDYDEDRILGKKGTFTNYKGTYVDRPIVVRAFSSDGANNEDLDFVFNEIVMLSQINHRNVVRLLGCCTETEVPLRVYQFIANGTLHQHIHTTDPCSSRITWENRLRIAIQVAEAITYLHVATPKPIVHRHIKPSNILLGENYMAKLSNFRIAASISPGERQVESVIKGSVGYLDPEYVATGLITEKCDVYGFGLVLLELLTAKKALDPAREKYAPLENLVISSINKKKLGSILDPGILQEGTMQEFTAVAALALKCLRKGGAKRPEMKEVVQELKCIQSSMHTSTRFP